MHIFAFFSYAYFNIYCIFVHIYLLTYMCIYVHICFIIIISIFCIHVCFVGPFNTSHTCMFPTPIQQYLLPFSSTSALAIYMQ